MNDTPETGAGTFALTIDTDGDAFDGDGAYHELPRILRKIADTIEAPDLLGTHAVLDVNGNTCGTWSYAPPIEDTGETVDLDELDTLGDALDALGIVGEVEAGDRLHGEYERTDGPASAWRAEAHAYSWTFTAPGVSPITGGYWTGSAITEDPSPVDVFASLVMDASYLAGEDEPFEVGMTLADVDIIRERSAWIRRALDRAGADGYPDAFDRLAELAHEHE